jgi:hypothetical protein
MVQEMTHSIPEGCIVDLLVRPTTGTLFAEVWQAEDARQRFGCEILTPLLRRVTGDESRQQPDPQALPGALRASDIDRRI